MSSAAVIPLLDPEDREAPPSPTVGALADCVETYGRWLHLDSADQVLFALGVVAANMIPGDPVWGLEVGAPGSGKTEVIAPVSALPFVIPAATVSEPALLSGTSKKESETGATGGLLRQIGDFGVLLIKDFTSVLSMNRDSRAQALAPLREVYDGRWDRPVGTGGGRVLTWVGKRGLLGAVTPSIDRHHAVMGALGERFILYRLPAVSPEAQARRRLSNRGRERQMRAELGEAVTHVLSAVDVRQPPRDLTDDEITHLVRLASFAVHARTAVERDGYSHEVVVMPAVEAPGRLVGALGGLLAGIEAVGAPSADAWRVVEHVAWDCVPDLRRRILFHLRNHGPSRRSDLESATGIPRATAERTTEDLSLLGLVQRCKSGDHDTAAWINELSAECRLTWPDASVRASSETSDGEDSL